MERRRRRSSVVRDGRVAEAWPGCHGGEPVAGDPIAECLVPGGLGAGLAKARRDRASANASEHRQGGKRRLEPAARERGIDLLCPVDVVSR